MHESAVFSLSRPRTRQRLFIMVLIALPVYFHDEILFPYHSKSDYPEMSIRHDRRSV
jgi:hypothetical protein